MSFRDRAENAHQSAGRYMGQGTVYSSKEGGRNVRLSDDIVSKKLWSGIFDTSRKFYDFPAERIKN